MATLDHLVAAGIEPLDWAADPLGQDNWQFQFHTLRWLWPLLHAAEHTGDDRYLDHAYTVAEDWVANTPSTTPRLPSPGTTTRPPGG